MPSLSRRDWPPSLPIAAALVSFTLVCGILYFGQVVLIPLALASLVAFLLAPVVAYLERWGVPRIAAAISAALVVVLLIASLGYLVVWQVRDLAEQLPSQRKNLKEKVADVREMFRGGVMEKIQRTFQEVSDEIEKEDASSAEKKQRQPSETPEPVPVQIAAEPSGFSFSKIATWEPVFKGLATSGLVIVLVVFMLIKREDLRNRLVSLTGQSSLATTTKALDEAGQRISRFLLMQFIINGSFGLAVGLGLLAIGVPYAILWGVCAAVLRYIPYIGPWISAVLPIGASLITSPGWSQALWVIGLFLVLELFSNNVMEPWLYGHSVGLSEFAVILSAVFWTWLWGPMGLVLATPLTACLVVLGRYIPALAFLDRLMGDRPALKPHIRFYQRVLARDENEAAAVAEEHLAEHSLESLCDEIYLPTLRLLQRDRSRGRINDDDQTAALVIMREVFDDLAERHPPQSVPVDCDKELAKVLVVGLPIRNRADELCLHLFETLLGPATCEFEALSIDMLIAEKLAQVVERRPACVCLVSAPLGDLLPTRQICKRLRASLPDLRILVGWLEPGEEGVNGQESLKEVGADRVVRTLSELRQAVIPLVQFYRHADSPAA